MTVSDRISEQKRNSGECINSPSTSHVGMRYRSDFENPIKLIPPLITGRNIGLYEQYRVRIPTSP
jgi:hypothetical protein